MWWDRLLVGLEELGAGAEAVHEPVQDLNQAREHVCEEGEAVRHRPAEMGDEPHEVPEDRDPGWAVKEVERAQRDRGQHEPRHERVEGHRPDLDPEEVLVDHPESRQEVVVGANKDDGHETEAIAQQGVV